MNRDYAKAQLKQRRLVGQSLPVVRFSRSGTRRRDQLQVADESGVLLIASFGRARSTADGWIVASVGTPSGPSNHCPRCFVDAELRAEHRLAGDRAEQPEHLRPHDRELGLPPLLARRDLGAFGFLWMRTLPRRLELEVLHRVGEVHARAIDARGLERVVEHLARGADERVAGVSSLSPGTSPISTSGASGGPSPNTVCVASL